MRITAIGLALFASAFSPALVALALVLSPFDSVGADVALVVVCAVPAFLVPVALSGARRLQDDRVRFSRVRRTDRDVLTFMSAFVLPIATAFFAVDVAKWEATSLLLLLLVVVYVRAQLFQLNPVLTVMGFRIYEVEDDRGVVVTVLSRRRRLPADGTLLAKRFTDELYLDLGERS
jgi:hypothetical protein